MHFCAPPEILRCLVSNEICAAPSGHSVCDVREGGEGRRERRGLRWRITDWHEMPVVSLVEYGGDGVRAARDEQGCKAECDVESTRKQRHLLIQQCLTVTMRSRPKNLIADGRQRTLVASVSAMVRGEVASQ